MSNTDSDLSTPPATDDEMPVDAPPAKAATKPAPQKKKKKNGTILSFFEKETSPPPRKKRAPSPPHEPAPEDNPDIAFIVMFRARFGAAFPPRCPNIGPQDLERGVAGDLPSPEIESLLCALLDLVNNRKKPVEKGHYGRALEEAVQTQKHQWPRSWNHTNPLHGGHNFNNMSPTDRLGLLKALVLWSLNQSEVITSMIKEAYKSRTTKDRADTNIPLSVQPWGKDGDKRRYFMIEGQEDTTFRVYRESNPALKHVTWWSVAGSIEELRALAKKLEEEDGSREAKALSERMIAAIPRLEAGEEKRKRREYRQARKAQFTRPDPGFSLYEGRTRGKRLKYTYSDDGEEDSEAGGVRRSTRNSGRESSAAPTGAPVTTASGRQVKNRAAGMYGESLLSGQTTDRASPATGDYIRSDASEEPDRPTHGRSTRAAIRGAVDTQSKKRKHHETYEDDLDDEDDATSWDGGDEEDDEPEPMDLDDEDEEPSDGEPSDTEEEPQRLIVRLKISQKALESVSSPPPPVHEDRIKLEGVSQPIPVSTAPQPQPAGMDAARQQPVPAPVPVPAPAAITLQPPPPPMTVIADAAANGIPAPPPPQDPIVLPSIAPAVQPPVASELPSLGSLFRAPTPPYSAQEEPKPQVQPEAPRSPQSFAATMPAPTPATNWQ